MKRIPLNIIVYALVALCSAFFVYLHVSGSADLRWFCHEDGLLENTQAVLFFLSAVIFLCLASRRTPSRGWYLLLGFFFFFMAGEEISWGQRIFGIVTPEALAEMNVQKEINFHNLKGLHGSARALGVSFIAGLCWAMPFLNRYSQRVRMFFKKWSLPVYPLDASVIMLLAVVFMLVPRVFYGTISYNMDEVGELWMALSFFLFTLAETKERNSLKLNRGEIV